MNGPDDQSRSDRQKDELLALVATLLLALATVGTAWSTYQASRWHGEQALAQSSATATRIESTRASGVANRQAQVDVAVFIEWVDAHAVDEGELEDFYRARFSDRLSPAFRAWIAQRPFEDPNAAPDPFTLPEYKIEALDQATALEQEASAASDEARENIQRADNYVLAVVMFASALFFGGLSMRVRTERERIAILGLGCILFLGTAIWIATFPVTVSI
jgi:hypothetical protein